MMNKKQLIAMWCGIALIVFMGIFPPLMLSIEGTNRFLGYGFISLGNIKLAMIDFTRLLTQWIVVSATTAGFLVTFKDKKKG